MKKIINIKNQGSCKGTVGWLCENAATISIGETRSGDQGAWLRDSEGKVLTVLAVRNFYGGADKEITKVKRDGSEYDLTCHIPCSDSAWESIQSLSEIAEGEMEKAGIHARRHSCRGSGERIASERRGQGCRKRSRWYRACPQRILAAQSQRLSARR